MTSMSEDTEQGTPPLEPQRSTHATPRIRKFFRMLGFDDGRDGE